MGAPRLKQEPVCPRCCGHTSLGSLGVEPRLQRVAHGGQQAGAHTDTSVHCVTVAPQCDMRHETRSTRAGGAAHPSPMASRCESSSDGRKTLRNSAEKTPPFFMTLVFRMLSVAVRFGCRNRNSLRGDGGEGAVRAWRGGHLWH